MRAKTLTEYSHSYQLPIYPCSALYLGAFWTGPSVSDATSVHLSCLILRIFSCHICQSEDHLAPRDSYCGFLRYDVGYHTEDGPFKRNLVPPFQSSGLLS